MSLEERARQIASDMEDVIPPEAVTVRPWYEDAWVVEVDVTKTRPKELLPAQVQELIDIAGIGGLTGGKLWWVIEDEEAEGDE